MGSGWCLPRSPCLRLRGWTWWPSVSSVLMGPVSLCIALLPQSAPYFGFYEPWGHIFFNIWKYTIRHNLGHKGSVSGEWNLGIFNSINTATFLNRTKECLKGKVWKYVCDIVLTGEKSQLQERVYYVLTLFIWILAPLRERAYLEEVTEKKLLCTFCVIWVVYSELLSFFFFFPII